MNKDKVFPVCCPFSHVECAYPASKQSPLCLPGWRGPWPTCPNSFELNRLGLGGYDSAAAGAAAAAREGAWNNFPGTY